MTQDEQTLRPGDVAEFVKLHEDTVTLTRKKDESVNYYSVEGKRRPCLILHTHANGYFLVWCVTTRPKGERFRLGVEWLDSGSSLQHKPYEIRWMHRNLVDKQRGCIGHLDGNDFQAVIDKWRLMEDAHGGPGATARRLHAGQNV